MEWNGVEYTLLARDAPIPASARSAFAADLDGDGVGETVTITSGRASLRRAGEVVWQSDASWLVTHALFADSNHDGRIELNIVLWKHGTYGPDKPFFVKDNDNNWGCHLFLYAWRAKALRCIWGSSAIDFPICEMAFADLRGDGKPDLIVLESRAGSDEHVPPTHLAVWRWNGWGFTNHFGHERGRYISLRVMPADDRDLVLVSRH